jgi:hypothetical protein
MEHSTTWAFQSNTKVQAQWCPDFTSWEYTFSANASLRLFLGWLRTPRFSPTGWRALQIISGECPTLGLAASKGTRAKWVAISSYIASALLYLLAIITGNFTIRTTCANCLVTIEVPYSLVSLFATLAAIGVLFFGITISIAILRGRTTKLGRLLLGSGYCRPESWRFSLQRFGIGPIGRMKDRVVPSANVRRPCCSITKRYTRRRPSSQS